MYSLLPLRRVSAIVEPGCGTGLLTSELHSLTSARITCIDNVERPGLPPGCVFLKRDATRCFPRAEIYVSSFFLYQLREPVAYLQKVRRALGEGGLYAVGGEFSYPDTGDDPLVSELAASLREEGFNPMFGSILEETFRTAGFSVVETGEVRPLAEYPDRDFLTLQLGSRGESFAEGITVPVFWGVFRAEGNRG
jgi:trans-aconitate methyltransferase